MHKLFCMYISVLALFMVQVVEVNKNRTNLWNGNL